MILQKLVVILLLLFTLSNCCKKEVIKKENRSITSKISEQVESNKLLNPITFAKRLDSLTVQLLDLRSHKEFSQGHIENATNINVLDSSFVTKIATYKKDIPVYVYCTHGKERSEKAAKIFKEKGYIVTILEGGLDAWVLQGNKVVKLINLN